MNAQTDKALADWTDLKEKIKGRWSKFADSEVDGFRDKMHLISEHIQKTYGYTKDKAEQEYKDFKTGLAATVSPKDAPKVN